MKKLYLIPFAIVLAGCQAQQPETLKPIAPKGLDKPTYVIPKPTSTPKPTPTMTPRQKRDARRAERRRIAKEKREKLTAERKVRAEKRRIAREEAEAQAEMDAKVEANKQKALAENDIQTTGNRLLREMDAKFVEDIPAIIKMSEKGSEILAEAGINESPSELMYQVNLTFDEPMLDDNGVNHQKYAEYLAMYISLRKGE